MAHSPIGILNGQGGEILIEMIQNQGGSKAFPKDKNFPALTALEQLADDGYLETLRETPTEVTYKILDD